MDKQFLKLLKERDSKISDYVIGRLVNTFFDSDVSGMGVLLAYFDMAGLKFKKVTNNCLDFFGYTKEEMEGKHIKELLHPDDLIDSVNTADNNTYYPNVIINYRNRYIHKDGSILHLVWDISPSTSTETFCICRIEKIEKG